MLFRSRIARLLRQLPSDPAVWADLHARYRVRLSFGIFFDAWNRGFDLSPASLRSIADLGVPLGFDIYAETKLA